MSEFAKAFRRARLDKDVTFREVAAKVGRSIGYLSEMENGKKNPPRAALAKKIADFLNAPHLISIAAKERQLIPSEIVQVLRERPKVVEVMYYANSLTDVELEHFSTRFALEGETTEDK